VTIKHPKKSIALQTALKATIFYSARQARYNNFYRLVTSYLQQHLVSFPKEVFLLIQLLSNCFIKTGCCLGNTKQYIFSRVDNYSQPRSAYHTAHAGGILTQLLISPRVYFLRAVFYREPKNSLQFGLD